MMRLAWLVAGVGCGWCIGGVTAAPKVAPPPKCEPCQVCAPPSQVARLDRALALIASRQNETVEALGIVAGDCVVPGAWLDVGVVPVRDVVSRTRLTGGLVRD